MDWLRILVIVHAIVGVLSLAAVLADYYTHIRIR